MTRVPHDRPVRTCVGCGESAARTGMIRLSADSDGELRVVIGRSIAGRTAYLHAREECVKALTRSRRLARSLRRQIEPHARERFTELALDVLTRERTGLRELTVG